MKLHVPETAGLPSMRYKTAVSCARVRFSSGEKVLPDVPFIRPFSAAYITSP